MKFSIGWFDEDECGNGFQQCLTDFQQHISEVYFPWAEIQTCRSDHMWMAGVKERLAKDLKAAADHGIKLCLLANANCYGEDAFSQKMRQRILRAVDELQQIGCPVQTVTTTSLFVADVVKNCFPDIRVRASVNMGLAEWWQMEKLFDLFDGFYLAREKNHDLPFICDLKKALEEQGKSLHLLANSGCMKKCPGATFHDNMVAHEQKIAMQNNVTDFLPYLCWRYYQKEDNWPQLLGGSWVRPEDIHHYEGLFDDIKLATRIHQHPRMVIKAYCDGSFSGNTLALTEPSHAGLIPGWVDNTKFPEEWFSLKQQCVMDCRHCQVCQNVWEKVFVPVRLGYGDMP